MQPLVLGGRWCLKMGLSCVQDTVPAEKLDTVPVYNSELELVGCTVLLHGQRGDSPEASANRRAPTGGCYF